MIRAEVKAKQKERYTYDNGEYTTKVDAFEFALGRRLGGEVEGKGSNDDNQNQERNLDQEGPAPSDIGVDESPKGTSQTHRNAPSDVDDALPKTALTQGNDVAEDEIMRIAKSAASKSAESASGEQDRERRGQAAHQSTCDEEDPREDD